MLFARSFPFLLTTFLVCSAHDLSRQSIDSSLNAIPQQNILEQNLNPSQILSATQKQTPRLLSQASSSLYGLIVGQAPAEFDWRSSSQAITPVKNMGTCYAQGAFAANAYLQSLLIINFNQARDLSEQFLISCYSQTIFTCAPANRSLAVAFIEYARLLKGLPSEQQFPYLSANRTTGTQVLSNCSPISNIVAFDPSKFAGQQLYDQSVEDFKQGIVRSPGLVWLRVSQNFLNYTSGVIECEQNILYDLTYYNVQVVGYSSSGNYWIVKNSMGSGWGENGFGRISMDTSKDCGIRRYFFEVRKFEGIVRVGLTVLVGVLMLIGI